MRAISATGTSRAFPMTGRPTAGSTRPGLSAADPAHPARRRSAPGIAAEHAFHEVVDGAHVGKADLPLRRIAVVAMAARALPSAPSGEGEADERHERNHAGADQPDDPHH